MARRTLTKELESAKEEAAARRKRAAEKAQAIAELEAAQALEDSLTRSASEQLLRAQISELRSETDRTPDSGGTDTRDATRPMTDVDGS